MTDNNIIRNAICDALPADTSTSGTTLPPAHLYVPITHLKALKPECQLVVGTRGVGKSVWTAALYDTQLRKLLGAAIPQLDTAEVCIGFSERPQPDNYPDGDIFMHLRDSQFTPYQIWRAVIARWVAKILDKRIPDANWKDSVHWVCNSPEDFAQLVIEASQQLHNKNEHGIILFDALDRLSSSWIVMDEVVRDLLRVVLWLKPYPNLSAKVFLREDQMERTVADFPDASKVLATKAELSWEPHDLHGLLWQYLLNSNGNDVQLKNIYSRIVQQNPLRESGRFIPHNEVKRATQVQRKLFEALAGPWMGRDKRRGVPYVWSVSHLSDGQGRTSPRSFIAAIRQAAEDTLERYPEHDRILHYESIKKGVQTASEIRVNELAEDYPWVKSILEPLNGLTVPIDFEDIQHHWAISFPEGPDEANKGESLPPQHSERGWPGVKNDLLDIGVFETRKKDGRIDMPDLYRVGFGLGRRGGVKPRR